MQRFQLMAGQSCFPIMKVSNLLLMYLAYDLNTFYNNYFSYYNVNITE